MCCLCVCVVCVCVCVCVHACACVCVFVFACMGSVLACLGMCIHPFMYVCLYVSFCVQQFLSCCLGISDGVIPGVNFPISLVLAYLVALFLQFGSKEQDVHNPNMHVFHLTCIWLVYLKCAIRS